MNYVPIFETTKRRAKVILVAPVVLAILFFDALADAWDEYDVDLAAFWHLCKSEWRGSDD